MPHRAIKWLKSRRMDVIAQTVICVTLLQLGIGLLLVNTVKGQSTEVLTDRIMQRQQTLDNRVTALEHMNLAVRLAVLERAADEVGQVKLLIYGVFVTLIGSLIAQMVQIRGQKRMRRDGDE